MPLNIQFHDENFIRILSKIPEQQREQHIIHRYTVGDIALEDIHIATNQQGLEEFFGSHLKKSEQQSESFGLSLKQEVKSELKDHYRAMEKLSKQMLNDSKSLATQIATDSKQQFTQTFAPTAKSIEAQTQNLSHLHQSLVSVTTLVSNSSKKGALSQEIVLTALRERFLEDTIESVSEKSRFTDIVATIGSNQQQIFIEIKDYSSTVPTKEVTKFWRDLESRNASFGLFISLNSKITHIPHDFQFQQQGTKIAVFVTSEAGHSAYLIAYQAIRKVAEVMNLPTSTNTSNEKVVELMVNLLNSRLKEVKDQLPMMEQVVIDLEKQRIAHDKCLSTQIVRLSTVRNSIYSVIENAVNDFKMANLTD